MMNESRITAFGQPEPAAVAQLERCVYKEDLCGTLSSHCRGLSWAY